VSSGVADVVTNVDWCGPHGLWPAQDPPTDPIIQPLRNLACAVLWQALTDAQNETFYPVKRAQAAACLRAPSVMRDFWLTLAALRAYRFSRRVD
jgi:hypothetical protein